MKVYVALAGFAFAILAFAAVWLGGLNQDEGWYLYAAQLVGEGKMLYRDFFYTQGPAMPIIYAPFAWVWRGAGLLGARLLTCGLGLLAILFAASLARLLVPEGKRALAGVMTFLLLGCNLYHIYYSSIPKTYALASLFVMMGYYLLACAFTERGRRFSAVLLFVSGLSLAFAAGTRISLGLLLAVCGFGLLLAFRRYGWSFFWFGLGGALGLLAVYGPFVFDPHAFAGLCAAQKYHAARGGFDPVFTIGSFSRLVRWYLPIFVLLGLGVFGLIVSRRKLREAVGLVPCLALVGFLLVFGVQMLAPFPYEDYQVPVMGLLAVFASVLCTTLVTEQDGQAHSVVRQAHLLPLLALGLTWAGSFGSPLLEGWMTDGQDRFWSRKKSKPELAQLQEMAAVIESVDPGGTMLLTQDLYLAVESGRKVPEGLEMGPFSQLSDEAWIKLLSSAPCEIAALSGYSFCINPPVCDERPIEKQLACWSALKPNYELVYQDEAFGQNSTSLLILKKKVAK